MTKLRKIGLAMSVVSAILWTIWLFAWWNYSFPPCEWPGWCVYYAEYHLIHFVLIALFVVWIGLILSEVFRKSLKWACIMSIISTFLWWLSLSFTIWGINGCIWDCWMEIITHIFWMLSLMLIVLWFVSLFFAIKYLTNSGKWGAISILIVVALLVTFLIQYIFMSPYNVSLIKMYTKFPTIMFLVFFVISIILLVAFFVRSHKEAKKSS